MISFIVPVKNGLAYTRALVETVRSTNPGTDIDWVVVDSGSTDGTQAYCAEHGIRVIPFRSEPFNYCAALNAGAAAAHGDLWVISNNDVEFRSGGDLERVEQTFRAWPVVDVVSPGRPEGEAEMEFRHDWLYGPCWAIRAEAFRSWGGMPGSLSGYGYDELWTVFQCWRRQRTLACLTGWSVFHHGSATFGPAGGNTSPALRRNLSRLLALLDATDLDRGTDPHPAINRLLVRELEKAPALLAGEARWVREIPRQGYANVRRVNGPLPEGVALISQSTTSPDTADRQWLPWLANELLLQPEAAAVGTDGVYAVRSMPSESHAEANEQILRTATAVGPPAPRLMSPLPVERTTLLQRIRARVNDWRFGRRRLPEGW